MGKRSSNKEKITSFLALLSFTAYMPVSSLPAFADISATTLPDLNNAVNGSVSTSGSRMDVSVDGTAGTVGQFDWNTFNVGSDAQVNWVFNANSQTALNRVLASGGMSYIYGKLTESSGNGCPSCVNTSKVILINPSGILFGNGSSVDLNSFTASTYDIKGIKNISELTEDELKDYAGSGGATGGLFDIAGYNKTISFVANDNMIDGNGYITSDATGTKLASIVAEGADINADKTIAFVGNKIDISNSNLQTTYSSTPNASNETQTKSNVKLVTGDGVNFYYTTAGNVNNSVTVSSATKTTDENYGISIADSEIRTGNFLAYNGVDNDNSSVDISGSTIYTKKLLGGTYTSNGVTYSETETGTDGNIQITSKGTVNITESNIQTTNDAQDGVSITDDIGYGNMTISGKRGVTITDSQLRTADSTANSDSSNITAGNITIKSSAGDINIVQTDDATPSGYSNFAVSSRGDLTIAAAGDVNIDGYDKIQATGNGTSSTTERTISVSGANVNFADTLLDAANINVDSADAINVTDTTVLASNANLHGANTTIDNSLLQYSDLSFYDEDSDKLNNVTIKNDTTLNDKDNDTLVVSTNGNLTLDNATLKKQAYGSSSASNQTAVSLESTNGDVALQNGTHIITTDGDIVATAAAGKINVDDSYLYATSGNVDLSAQDNVAIDSSTVWAKDGNLNLTSAEGKVTVTNSNAAAEGGNTTIVQNLSMNIDEDFAGSMVGATDKLTLKTNGDIAGTTLKSGTGYINDYTDLVSLNNSDAGIHFIYAGAELNAGNDVNITDVRSAKNVDFVAGNDIDLASTVNMKLTDVTVNAGNTTDITAEGNLVTNGFSILGGEKTTLDGSTVTTADDTVIATNGYKLAVNADTDIDIAVTGVTNTANGLEINADVNTSGGSDPLEGKDVSVTAADGTLAISKIKADTLNLTADTILAGDTTISADTDNVSGLVEAGVDMDSKAYIEVRTDGGFNLDATTDYNDSNAGIYTGGNYGTTSEVLDKVAVGDTYTTTTETIVNEVSNSELISSNTTVGDEVGRTTLSKEATGSTSERTDNVTQNGEEGYTITTTTTYEVTDEVTYSTTTVDTYKDTTTTTTEVTTNTYQDYEQTTNSRDAQHIATLNNDEQNAFVLVYGKNSSSTESAGSELVGSTTDTVVDTVVTDSAREVTSTGTTTATDTYTVTETTETFCAYEIAVEIEEPAVEVAEVETASVEVDVDPASLVKIPRHSEGTSNVATVQNDLADTTSTVVAAAARLQLDEEGNSIEDSGLDLDDTNTMYSDDDDDYELE